MPYTHRKQPGHPWAHFYFREAQIALSWVDFFSPLALLAVGLMALNDAWLRLSHPNFLTGKLSDFAVLFFFPLFVCALFSGGELLMGILRPKKGGRRIEPSDTKLKIACVFTAIVFSLLQFSAAFVDLYLSLLETLDWPQYFGAFQYTRDPSDLIALPVLVLAYHYGRARRKKYPLTNP